MIILAGKNPVANVLHVMVGPETDFWSQLHGAAAVDLTPILRRVDQSLPVYLHLTRCDDEHDMAQQLGTMMQAGGHYPFVPPTFVFTPRNATDAEQQASAPVFGGPLAGPPPGVPPTQKQQTGGVCSRCGNKQADLVPKLKPPICYGCVQIDLHLARKFKQVGDQPQGPTEDEQPTV